MRTSQMGLVRSLRDGLASRFQQTQFLRSFSTNALSAADENTESIDEKLDQIGKGQDSFGSKFPWRSRRGNFGGTPDGLDESFQSLQDRTERNLENAASSLDGLQGLSSLDGITNDMDHVYNNRNFSPRQQSREFEVTTEEVLRKADFRNVRFLANFITEGGIIIKRKQTRISATAQRKVAREIKKARAFGLMPFTTQGTKPFKFGTTMEDREEFYYSGYSGNNQNFVQPSETESLKDNQY